MLARRRHAQAHPLSEFGLSPAGWRELLEIFAQARHIKVFSGAGLAVASGLPTFRGSDDALWSQLSYEELATKEGYLSNPARVWAWYAERAQQLREAQPNAAHRSLAALERHFKVDHFTQNVDDLLERAGCTHVHHLHGQMARPRCMDCRQFTHFRVKPLEAPTCCACGGLMRPDVVWFGEDLPEPLFSSARAEAAQADVWLVVGTAGDVYPAAALPEDAARAGVPVININPEETSLSAVSTYDLRGGAEAVLPQLVGRVVSAGIPPSEARAWWQNLLLRWTGL